MGSARIIKFTQNIYEKHIRTINASQKDLFINHLNGILSNKQICLKEDGTLSTFENNMVKYEEKLISDSLDRHNLLDIKERLSKAENLLENAILTHDDLESTMSAQQAGIALEGVLKYIYFKICKDDQNQTTKDLNNSIYYYLSKFESKNVKFLGKDDALYIIINAIREEFRNISSHYSLEDLKTLDTRKIKASYATLCLWTSKAAILCLLKKYEEEYCS